MKSDIASWCDPDFDQRKLPNYEQIQNFFNCFDTAARPFEESFFKPIPTHNYVSSNDYYARTNKKYPILVPTSEFKEWITPALSNVSGPLSLSANSLIGIEGYNCGITEQRKLPSLAMRLDANVKSDIVLASSEKCLSYERTIKSTKDISSIYHRIRTFISNIQQHEIDQFKIGLRLGNYIESLSHMGILNKIKKLREIYPSDPIYILGKQPLLDYLYVHCSISPGQLVENTWLILDESHRYHRSQNDMLDDYKSAVFTLNGMKGSHSFQLYWETLRGSRVWNIYVAGLAKVGFDIPKDITQSSNPQVSTLKPKHPRWGTLFL